MYPVALLCVALQAVVSLVVGVRLLGLARRTRQFPELALSLSTLLLPGLGYPSALAAMLVEHLQLPGVAGIFFFSVSIMMLAIWMNYLFTWRVFRPQAGWALVLCGVGAWLLMAPIGAVCAHVGADGIDAGIRNARIWTLTIVAAGGAGYVWTSVESFRYYRNLRRRLRLGLVAPAVCNRFLLWALLSAAWVMTVVVAAVVLRLDLNPLSNVPFTISLGASGLANAVCTALCFMPPRRYLAWLEGGTPAVRSA